MSLKQRVLWKPTPGAREFYGLRLVQTKLEWGCKNSSQGRLIKV